MKVLLNNNSKIAIKVFNRRVHTSLISDTGNFNFLRGCLSNTYLRLGHSRSGRLAIN